tara:strand:- start:104 stop:742 length:639 start_codon:yes stop_codon:yes gene_type:complete
MVDDLQVLSVEDIEDVFPRTLRLVGRGGFNTAQRVVINDYGVDTFVVVSDTIMLVVPGAVFDSVPIESMNVVVISGELTNTQRVRLVFGPTVRLRKVTGVQKLVQQVVKTMLSNAGSNRFRVQEGGSLLKLTGFSMTPAAKPRIVTALSQAISATETQVVAAQANVRGLPLDERLLSLALGSVSFNDATLEVQANIALLTYVGRSVSLPLVL